MAIKHVKLHLNILANDECKIMVTPHDEVLSKRSGDEIEWTSNLPFSVDFEASPFVSAHFDNANSRSGPVTLELPSQSVEQYCKYSVRIKDVRLDPGIIIRP